MTKFSIISLTLFLALSLSSCDDSGIVQTKNNVSFTYSNLKHLDPDVDGVYEAWISFDSQADHGDELYVSCGKFNIDPNNGELVDTAGNPVTLKLKYIPSTINTAGDAIVTIEPPFDTDTLPSTRLIGGAVTAGSDFLSADMDMKYDEVLGEIADNFTIAGTKYILNTPTDTSVQFYYNGIWFCDTAGTSLFTGLLPIADSLGWTYEAWVTDTRTGTNYSLGRFSNPDSTDSDAAGQYANPPYSIAYGKPGQDYIRNTPPVSDLRAGYYRLMITLEPKNEPANSPPFFIRLFYRQQLQPLQYGENSPGLPNMSADLPTATIKVSK